MDKQTIKYRGKTIAHIFRKRLKSDGVTFLVPKDYTLQLGLLEHPANKVIKEHIHNQNIKYRVDTTQEFLYIERGKVLINFFSEDWKFLKRSILNKGDFVLFVSGGHGLKILKKSRIIEVKQGPYPGDKKAKIYRD